MTKTIKVKQELPHTFILGAPITSTNLTLAKETIRGWVEHEESRYVCVPDASGLVSARKDDALMKALHGADMVTPDGVPSVWISRMRGADNIERVTGLDLLPELCAYSAQYGWRHFFYGGAKGIAGKAAYGLAKKHPGVAIAGSYCPPFRDLLESEKQEIIDRINETRPDIVWVGLGLPKQEKWMVEHVGKINGATLIGIGFALDVEAGNKTRAPQWMQKCALEWLYRVVTEPKRLWKRYLVTIPSFVWLVVKESLLMRNDKA